MRFAGRPSVRAPMIRVVAMAMSAALLSLLLAASAAQAQVATQVQPEDPVPGAPDVTYLDLVREIVPDMTRDGRRFSGVTVIDLPHADAGYDMLPPVEPTLDRGIEAVALGGTRHLLLVDLGEPEFDVAGYAVLALFDASASPRLRSALNIGFDRWTFLVEPAVRPLGAARLVVAASEHSNSSQTYRTTVLMLLRDGRLEPLDDIFTFGDAQCSVARPQQLTIRTDPSPTAFDDIVATVTEHVLPSGLDCGDREPPEASSHTVTVVYRWDQASGKYVPDSDAFDRLAAESAERF